MLQVISGKFYKNPDRFSTPAKGITFSNYHTVAPIVTCVATLEPVNTHSTATSAYVINYTNVIEKPDSNRHAVMVRIGDEQIVRQFELLCIFGLKAFFDGDRNAVETDCRAQPTQGTEVYVPSQYVDRIFNSRIIAQPDEPARLVTLVERVIGLPRKQYTAVMNALEALAHSLEALNYQLELAYSMLVYSLESLCQTFDEFTPSWDHYEDQLRTELDGVFGTIPPDKAAEIREILLKASHLRLRRRFLGFASKYTKPSFYVEEAVSRQYPIKHSELERALGNAYDMRSGYVHELSPILKQLRVPHIAKGDVFTWEHEPYLSYSGLLRVVHHVISVFIEGQPTVATEDYNWLEAVPQLVQFQLAPEHWVGIDSGLTPAESRHKLSGTLSLIERAMSGTSGFQLNVFPLVEKLGTLVGRGSEAERSATLALYALLLHFLPPQDRPVDPAALKTQYDKAFRQCNIEMMLVWIITESSPLPWAADESAAVVEQFMRSKFRKTAIAVPGLLSLCLYAEIANRYLSGCDFAGYEKWSQIAVFEIPGVTAVQEYVRSVTSRRERIEPEEIVTQCRGFKSPGGELKSAPQVGENAEGNTTLEVAQPQKEAGESAVVTGPASHARTEPVVPGGSAEPTRPEQHEVAELSSRKESSSDEATSSAPDRPETLENVPARPPEGGAKCQ